MLGGVLQSSPRGERNCAGLTSSHAMAKILGQDVFIRATDRLVLLKAAEAKGIDVDERRLPLCDQFSHAGPYCRRNFKAGAAETCCQIQPLNPRRTIEDGTRIGADVVDPRMPTCIFSLLQGGDTTRGFGLSRWDEVSIVGFVIVIGIRGRLGPLSCAFF